MRRERLPCLGALEVQVRAELPLKRVLQFLIFRMPLLKQLKAVMRLDSFTRPVREEYCLASVTHLFNIRTSLLVLINLFGDKFRATAQIAFGLFVLTSFEMLQCRTVRASNRSWIDRWLAICYCISHILISAPGTSFLRAEEPQSFKHIHYNFGNFDVLGVLTLCSRALSLIIALFIPIVNTFTAVRCLAVAAHLGLMHYLEADLAREVVDCVFGWCACCGRQEALKPVL